MTVYTLYPSYVIIKYVVQDLEHKATIPVLASFSAPDWFLDTRGGAQVDWVDCVTNYVTELLPLFAAADEFTEAELWAYDAPDADPIFKAGFILGLAGTSTGTILAGQAVYAFRSEAGNIMRPTLMETNLALNVKLTYTGLGASVSKDIVDYILSSAGWLVARDGSFPIGLTYLTTKMNDHLREVRFNL